MKGFLRFLLALLGIVVLGILVLGIIEPKDFTLTRSIVINAPKPVVKEQVVIFKNWHNWSPWYKKDSLVQMTYFGTDGTQGSGYHWVGTSSQTGEGIMTNTGMTGDKMNFTLRMIKPMQAESPGYFNVADTANGQTVVTWSITMHHGYPMNAINAFMDKMLGPDFDNGLQYMKTYVEANAKPAAPAAPVAMDTAKHV